MLLGLVGNGLATMVDNQGPSLSLGLNSDVAQLVKEVPLSVPLLMFWSITIARPRMKRYKAKVWYV